MNASTRALGGTRAEASEATGAKVRPASDGVGGDELAASLLSSGERSAPKGGANMNTTIKRILVPHDFSETAEHALKYALDLAERLGASVTVAHVYDVPVYSYPEGPALTVEMTAQIERAAETALDALAQRSRRPGVEIDTALRRGSAWSEINAVAKLTNADLIVIGTHGRRGLARALLGSVAEKFVRSAPCPVLTVHVPETKH